LKFNKLNEENNFFDSISEAGFRESVNFEFLCVVRFYIGFDCKENSYFIIGLSKVLFNWSVFSVRLIYGFVKSNILFYSISSYISISLSKTFLLDKFCYLLVNNFFDN